MKKQNNYLYLLTGKAIRTCLVIFSIILIGTYTFGQKKYVPGELLIQFKEHIDLNSFQMNRLASGVDAIRYISKPLNIAHVDFDPQKHSFQEIAEIFERDNRIQFISRNQEVFLRKTPNDEHFDKQWSLHKIGVEKAWNSTTGGTTALGDKIVVAILDSGYDLNMEEILDNVESNSDESIGDKNGDGCPGICGEDDDGDGLIDEDGFDRLPGHVLYNPTFMDDDDENGYRDDVIGLNMLKKTDEHVSDNHGTGVAGIIGAKGNNETSVSGINWDVGMMLLSKVGNVSQIIEAYQYVYDRRKLYNDTNGERGSYVVVTNFSSGIDNEYGEDFPIWCGMYDLLGSIGILSVGATTNKSTNVDIDGDMPTTCSSEYLISVTNLTQQDILTSAGYGPINVDIGAPGNKVITLESGSIDNVGEFSGTSSATPHVTGTIALLYSIPCTEFAQYFKENPSRVVEIKHHLMNSVDPIKDLESKTVSEGRVNVFNGMKALREYCPGIQGGDLEIIDIYPNPSYREPIIIEYNGPDDVENFELSIFNMMGGLIYSAEFNPPLFSDKVFSFQPPELAAGTYILVVRDENSLVSKKHVIIPYR